MEEANKTPSQDEQHPSASDPETLDPGLKSPGPQPGEIKPPAGESRPAEAPAARQPDGSLKKEPLSANAEKDPHSLPDKTTPPAKSEHISPGEAQKKQRGENHDAMRVMDRFGSLPYIHVDYMNVERDVQMGAGGSAVPDVSPPSGPDSAEVPRREINKIRQVFQPPLNFQRSLDQLRSNRLIALTGRPNVGKRSFAISLALELNGNKAIRELSPDVHIPRQVNRFLDAAGGEKRMVMIADGLLREAAHSLKPPLGELLSRLERSDSYLILCVPPDISLSAEIKHIQVEPPAVSGEILFQAHLDYYQGDLGEQVDELIAKEERIQRVIKEEKLSPRQADALAERIVAAVHYKLDVDEALVSVVADFMDEEISQWISETADTPDDTVMRIALAVFSGWTLSEILQASRDLKTRLFPPPPESSAPAQAPVPAPPEPRPSPLKRTASDVLRRAGAKRVQSSFMTQYSEKALIEVVELDKPSYSKALLKYLWQEIFEWQEPLLDWLMHYATTGVSPMRTRAAGAIGALASVDFPAIRSKVFNPWGYTDLTDPDQRRERYQALTNAVGVLIWDDDQSPNVLGLLDFWSTKGGLNLRWAAARAYSSVGLRYPREAVSHWRTILESENEFHLALTRELGLTIYSAIHLDFIYSLMDAILNLFMRAVEMPHRLRPVYEQAVSSLLEWAELDEKDDKEKANGLTLFILATDIRFPPEDGSGEFNDWPPAMLYVANSQPGGAYLHTLASLLRKALNHANADFAASAAEALHRWVICADDQLWIWDTLAQLLKTLLGLPDIRQRETGRLWRHLTGWATSPHKPSPCAQHLLDTLKLQKLVSPPGLESVNHSFREISLRGTGEK